MKSYAKRLRPDELTVVSKVQREPVQAWVRKLKRRFDPGAIGAIYVSKRRDGTLAIIDGQHRVLALIELGRGDKPIHCIIYEGLTEAEEADSFLKFADHRSVQATDKFRIGVAAGREDCVAVDQILHEFDLRMKGDSILNGHSVISCPTSLLTIYNRNSPDRDGPQALRCALQTAIAAFGMTDVALDGKIVSGLGELFLANGWIESGALADKLAKFPGGAAGLIGSARGRYAYEKTTLAKCLAKVAADAYNSRRTKGRIEV